MDNLMIKGRYDALTMEKKVLEQTLQLIEQFMVPFRGKFFRTQSSELEIEWRRREIYDSTAIMAVQTLASSMQSGLTSPSAPWFGLRYRQEWLNDDITARTWLEICAIIMRDVLHDSNFDVESAEFYTDLVAFGTAVITEEAESETEWEGLDFSSVPMREIFFEENYRGGLLRLYRRFQWRPLQIVDKFGKEKLNQVAPHIVEQSEQLGGASAERQEIIFVVYPRDEVNLAELDTTQPIPPLKRPYGWKYILHRDGTLLDEGGYYEMPAFVSRWRKVSGSTWGYGPAHIALSDVLTVNELVETNLEALAKVVDPALVTTQRGVIGDLDLARGGLTVLRSMQDLAPFESGAKFEVTYLDMQRLQTAIDKAFYVDQLQLKESPAMTATEVQVRYEMMQRLLGPTLGRLQTDFLDPVIGRTFAICARAGLFPDMPPVVQDNQGQMAIEYLSPMARAQRMDSSRSTQEWLGTLGGMAEFMPDVLHLPDSEEIARGLGRDMNVPAKFIRTKKEVAQRIAAEKEQQEKMMASQQAQAEGQAQQAQAEGAKQMRAVQ